MSQLELELYGTLLCVPAVGSWEIRHDVPR